VTDSRVAANVRLKRIYDPPDPADGYRVLTTRYWPRGVPKAAADEYSIKTSPSRELLRAFKHEGLPWQQYVNRYLAEMQDEEARSAISRLATIAQSRTITLMCICEDGDRCHRKLLKELLLQEIERSR
jgi:uncharacterized protein YeaO (DUF488 family)